MARSRRRILWAVLFLLPWPVAWAMREWQPVPAKQESPAIALKLETNQGMVLLPKGTFFMGSPYRRDQDARPVHRVSLRSFWIDATPVTNRQFFEFVEETGFVTTAERLGEGLVFDFAVGTWRNVAGASWKHPSGPESSIATRDEYPVVQVSWHDAAAFAKWAGKRLPTEAEMEYAARGGLNDCDYPWGREIEFQSSYPANYWQGPFPGEDLGRDGFRNVAPTKSYAPNRFGLFDMAGNVCQWCGDWYAADYYALGEEKNPLGAIAGEYRVRRGGSWLSTSHSSSSMRVFHRGFAPPGESTNHSGFRCAKDF